jgi:hypothetical protein
MSDPISDQTPDKPVIAQPGPASELAAPNLVSFPASKDASSVGSNNASSSVPGSVPNSNQVTEFHIGEEFGTAKRNLPPVRIVLVCIAAVAVVVGIFAFKGRPKPQGGGAIDFVTASEVPNQGMILAAITFTLRNTGVKPLWIKSLKAQLTTSDGKAFEDEAASAVDLDRYFQAFPALKESAEPPISPETKLLPGGEQRGTIIVSFKVPRETFDQRKSLTVTIEPYDQVMPVILK